MLQGQPGVAGTEDGAIGDGLVQELPVVGLRGGVTLEQEVRVGVDEARENRKGREVDDLRRVRLGLELGGGSDGLDALPLDQDAHGRLRRVGAAVDQSASLDEDLLRCRGALRGGPRGDGEEPDSEQPERSHEHPPWISGTERPNLLISRRLASGPRRRMLDP